MQRLFHLVWSWGLGQTGQVNYSHSRIHFSSNINDLKQKSTQCEAFFRFQKIELPELHQHLNEHLKRENVKTHCNLTGNALRSPQRFILFLNQNCLAFDLEMEQYLNKRVEKNANSFHHKRAQEVHDVVAVEVLKHYYKLLHTCLFLP